MLERLVNVNTIANIINPTTGKKPTNEQSPPIDRETKIEHFFHSSFKLDIIRLEPEKLNIRFSNKKFFVVSYFDLEILQRVRFWIKFFSSSHFES